MRRRLLIIVCCLAAGAVVNTIVAWSCALWSGSNTLGEVEIIKFDPERHPWHAEHMDIIRALVFMGDIEETLTFGRSVHAAQGPPFLIYSEEQRIQDGDQLIIRHADGIVFNYQSRTVTFPELELVRTGWPCLAFEGGRGRPSKVGAPAPPVQYFNAIEVDSEAGIPLPANESRRLVPLAPIWSGFIINTLFYAALIWCLSAGPFVARRRLRRRRGRCLKCAYPIGERDVCTECGEQTK